mmetsp:Transcript_95791/g.170043  ORF Transcript_95791/g.170043 Transcript_95791/m.170043 type:complete len:172 (-) Transcript_95791:194-709(-)
MPLSRRMVAMIALSRFGETADIQLSRLCDDTLSLRAPGFCNQLSRPEEKEAWPWIDTALPRLCDIALSRRGDVDSKLALLSEASCWLLPRLRVLSRLKLDRRSSTWASSEPLPRRCEAALTFARAAPLERGERPEAPLTCPDTSYISPLPCVGHRSKESFVTGDGVTRHAC